MIIALIATPFVMECENRHFRLLHRLRRCLLSSLDRGEEGQNGGHHRWEEEEVKIINYKPFCKELKINFRGHLAQPDYMRGSKGIYGPRLMEMLIEINVLQFSHDMKENLYIYEVIITLWDKQFLPRDLCWEHEFILTSTLSLSTLNSVKA